MKYFFLTTMYRIHAARPLIAHTIPTDHHMPHNPKAAIPVSATGLPCVISIMD